MDIALQPFDTDFTIHINANNMLYYSKLLSKIPTNEIDNFEQMFKESCKVEHEIAKKVLVQRVKQYMKENRVPQIIELYEILFPSVNPIRNEFVGVYKGKKGVNGEEYYNVGMKPSQLDLIELQKLVKWFYELNNDKEFLPIEVIGYICYLLYERIHPHLDGNGRMGRLLFIENYFVHYPLSELIHKMKPNIVDGIFRFVNFPAIIYNGNIVQYKTPDEYHEICINDELLRKIVKLVGLCKEYDWLSRTMKPNMICKLLRKRINKGNVEIEGFDIDNHNLLLSL